MVSRIDGPPLECYVRMSEVHQKGPAEVVRRSLSMQREIEIPLSTSLKENIGAQMSLQLQLHMMFAALLNWHIRLDADALDTIRRHCFLKGLSQELRVALRRDPQTTTKKVQDLAAEVVRLQLAGVGSMTPQTQRVA